MVESEGEPFGLLSLVRTTLADFSEALSGVGAGVSTFIFFILSGLIDSGWLRAFVALSLAVSIYIVLYFRNVRSKIEELKRIGGVESFDELRDLIESSNTRMLGLANGILTNDTGQSKENRYDFEKIRNEIDLTGDGTSLEYEYEGVVSESNSSDGISLMLQSDSRLIDEDVTDKTFTVDLLNDDATRLEEAEVRVQRDVDENRILYYLYFGRELREGRRFKAKFGCHMKNSDDAPYDLYFAPYRFDTVKEFEGVVKLPQDIDDFYECEVARTNPPHTWESQVNMIDMIEIETDFDIDVDGKMGTVNVDQEDGDEKPLSLFMLRFEAAGE